MKKLFRLKADISCGHGFVFPCATGFYLRSTKYKANLNRFFFFFFFFFFLINVVSLGDADRFYPRDSLIVDNSVDVCFLFYFILFC